MVEVSERDERQLALIRKRVQDLRDGQPIAAVISDLEALVWQLAEPLDPWRQRFLAAWGQMEVAYALALESGDHSMPTATDPMVGAALDDIDVLLDEIER